MEPYLEYAILSCFQSLGRSGISLFQYIRGTELDTNSYLNNIIPSDDPSYRSQQASLWAQHTENASTLGPFAPQSLALLDEIFQHMLAKQSLLIRVARRSGGQQAFHG